MVSNGDARLRKPRIPKISPRIEASPVFQDITETKTAEKALRESEERFRTLFESLSAGSCLDELVYDENGRAVDYRILDVNPADERIMGISRSEAVHALGSRVYGTGEPESFETSFAPTGRLLEFRVSSPSKGRFSTVM